MSPPTPWEATAARSIPPVLDHDDRACKGEDTEIFFPSGRDAARAEEALAICGGCAHRRPCLEWALKTGQMHGILGGTTPDDRRKILKNRGNGMEPNA